MCCLGIGGKLHQLEGLFIGGSAQGGRAGNTVSIETLIDILLVLYDECCNSSLRREKTVSDFIEFGKWIVSLESWRDENFTSILKPPLLISVMLSHTYTHARTSITLFVLRSETDNFVHQELAIDTGGL